MRDGDGYSLPTSAEAATALREAALSLQEDTVNSQVGEERAEPKLTRKVLDTLFVITSPEAMPQQYTWSVFTELY